jgi:hypothetical protein
LAESPATIVCVVEEVVVMPTYPEIDVVVVTPAVAGPVVAAYAGSASDAVRTAVTSLRMDPPRSAARTPTAS